MSTLQAPKLTEENKANRFQAFKVSLCGNQIRRDIQSGLTLEQARAFPTGKQKNSAGTYIWSYSLMGRC